MTRKEQALKIIAKQIKELDSNDILLQEVGFRFHSQEIRLRLWDMITSNGYSLEQGSYKLLPFKTKKKPVGFQCGSCENEFKKPNKDNECPHCGSGNYVEGTID